MSDKYWLQPLKWDRAAAKAGERHRVFCSSMADVFELLPLDHPDAARQEDERMRLWQLIGNTPNLDWLLLTKRPENFWLLPWVDVPRGTWAKSDRWAAHVAQTGPLKVEPWSNVWVGVTAENQEQAGIRIPALMETPAAVRFVSYEPALEEVDFFDYLIPNGIDWVIAGAESGRGARVMDEDWVRRVRDQCVLTDTAFLYKQRIEDGKKVELPELDGQVWAEFPTSNQALKDLNFVVGPEA